MSGFFLFVSFIFLGSALFSNYQHLSKNHIFHVAKYYRGNPVFIEGVIISDVHKRDFFKGKKTTFELQVYRLKTRWGWRKKIGKVLVNIFSQKGISYGDYVRLEGKLHEPFEFSTEKKFSYKDYLRRRGIKLILSVKKKNVVEILRKNKGNFLKSYSLRVRNRLKMVLARHLTENEAGLMQAILLGDRSTVPRHIRKLFAQTGTAHILAISGLHIGIIAFLIFLFLKALPIPRRGQYIFTILLLIFYAFLTGGRPSVVRATIMTVVFLSGFLLERESEPINSLSLAALIILIFNPFNLFDVGFQLSFMSVLAIIHFYPILFAIALKSSINMKNRFNLFIVRSIIVSLSVWLGVVGLIAYYFQMVTPITILANIVIIPLISVVVALGLGLLIVGVVFSTGAFIFGACAKLMLNTMVGLIYLIGQLPGAYFYIDDISPWHVLAYYTALIVLSYMPRTVIKLTKAFKYVTVNRMKKIIIFLLSFLWLFGAGPIGGSALYGVSSAYAFWVWTPETNKWVNPKYAVKDTPREQLKYALESYETQDYKKAILEFNKLIKNYPRAREAAEAQFFVGVCLEEQGKIFEAFRMYQKVVDKYPFSERSASIVERQYKIGEKILEGEGRKNKFVSVVVGADYDVVEVFRTVIKNSPYGTYAAPSQYKIGLYLLEKGMYQEARDELEKVINDYPNSEWVKAARYQIASADAERSTDSAYDQKVTEAAVKEFEEFVKVYPDAELSERARDKIQELKEKEAENNFLIARFYEKQKNYEAARIYYNTILKEYPKSKVAVKSKGRLRTLSLKN